MNPKKEKEYAFATHSQSLTFFSFHALSPIRFVLSGCGKERFTSSSNWCWNRSLEVGTITHSFFSFLQVLYTIQTNKQTNKPPEGKTVIIPITRCFLFFFWNFNQFLIFIFYLFKKLIKINK